MSGHLRCVLHMHEHEHDIDTAPSSCISPIEPFTFTLHTFFVLSCLACHLRPAHLANEIVLSQARLTRSRKQAHYFIHPSIPSHPIPFPESIHFDLFSFHISFLLFLSFFPILPSLLFPNSIPGHSSFSFLSFLSTNGTGPLLPRPRISNDHPGTNQMTPDDLGLVVCFVFCMIRRT